MDQSYIIYQTFDEVRAENVENHAMLSHDAVTQKRTLALRHTPLTAP